jgi:tetratricopeptide (TPR) repeat protein
MTAKAEYEIDRIGSLSKLELEEMGEDFPQFELNVSDEILSKYYSAALEYIDEKNFLAARDAFSFLTFLNPSITDFWIGLGISEQSQEEFQKAVEAYQIGEIVDPNNPVVHANICQCYLALKDEFNADQSYEKCMNICGDNSDYQFIKTAITQFKENFKNK